MWWQPISADRSWLSTRLADGLRQSRLVFGCKCIFCIPKQTPVDGFSTSVYIC